MSRFTNAYVIKNGTYTVDGHDFSNQVNKARLVPNTSVQTLPTMVPDGVLQDVAPPVWTFQLTATQGSVVVTGTAVNIDEYMTDHAGSSVTIVMTPNNGGRIATFSMVAVAVDFGGDQGTYATFDGSFPVQGQPVFT